MYIYIRNNSDVPFGTYGNGDVNDDDANDYSNDDVNGNDYSATCTY